MSTIQDTKLATLTLVIEFDELPTHEHLENLMDVAKEFGFIAKADLAIHGPTTQDLRP